MPATDLESLSTLRLLQTSAQIVTRTSNITGDYAEHLFARAFGWTLLRSSNVGHDAEHEGKRYQIKCRRVTLRNPSRQLGEFSDFDTARFDFLAAVIFDRDFVVHRAAIMQHATVGRLSTVVKGRRRFILRDQVWLSPDVRDVTAELKATQLQIG
jgi:hypothetical protein